MFCWSHVVRVGIHVEPGCVKSNVTELVILDAIKIIISDVLSRLDVTELHERSSLIWPVHSFDILSQFHLSIIVRHFLLNEDASVWNVKFPGGNSGDKKC